MRIGAAAARVRDRPLDVAARRPRRPGPTKSTATRFPRRRSAISIGYAFLMNARRAVLLARDLRAALARRLELGLQAADVALERLLLGVVDLPAHGDADQDPDQERDEDGSERGNVIAEVEHGGLQSCSSLAKGVQSGERLPWQRAQPLELRARHGGASMVRVARVVPSAAGSSRISA